jgi:hypothetical protein
MLHHLKGQDIRTSRNHLLQELRKTIKNDRKIIHPNLAVSAINAFLFSKHKGNHFFYNKGGKAFFLQIGTYFLVVFGAIS